MRGGKKISDIWLRINFSLLRILSNILNSKVGKMQYTIKNILKVMRHLIIKMISKSFNKIKDIKTQLFIIKDIIIF